MTDEIRHGTVADLTPETLAAWREDAEWATNSRRILASSTVQANRRILRLLDELVIGIRAHVRTMERAEKAERKYADLVVEILSLATKWKEEILSDDLDFDLYAVPEILQSLVNGENRD